ncbi:hypothetical protein ACR30L_18920 [Psychromonas sp. PT13]|uniref:hypothetical protein n=1 Tax=Psychromonas sp. PT13 TaxID=3439547 RepID=UPI003EBC0AF1
MAKYFKNVVRTAVALPAVFLINGVVSSASADTINFDNLTAGTQIDAADPSWSVDKVDGSTMLAEVSAKMAKSGSNSLYLLDDSTADKPYAILPFENGPAASGSISFDAYIPSDNAKTVYINVGVGKNNSQRYFEIRLSASEGKAEYENGSPDMKFADFTPDQWHTYTATWGNGKFSIAIDGVAMPDATDISVESTGLSTDNIPTTVTFYAGDKSSKGTAAYIDNVKIK